MQKLLKEFQIIPGIGKSMAQDLVDLGYSSLEELRNENPQKMFENLCELREELMDRCVLYVFRGAVYFVSNERHNPDLLKWWNWKDSNMNNIDPITRATIHAI